MESKGNRAHAMYESVHRKATNQGGATIARGVI